MEPDANRRSPFQAHSQNERQGLGPSITHHELGRGRNHHHALALDRAREHQTET